VRLTFTALGRTWLDLAILDDDPADDGAGAAGAAELFTGTPPFGFRPTPDPWPPSWE
jgi:hypothetical protein